MKTQRWCLIIFIVILIILGSGCFEVQDDKVTFKIKKPSFTPKTESQATSELLSPNNINLSDQTNETESIGVSKALDSDGDFIADSIDDCPHTWGNMNNGCYQEISEPEKTQPIAENGGEEKCRSNVERKMKVDEEKLPFNPSNPTIVEIKKFSTIDAAADYLIGFNIYTFMFDFGEFKGPILIAMGRWDRDVPSVEGRSRYFIAYFCNLDGELSSPNLYQS